VVRRVNWTSNTVTVATIPHTITTTTIPTVAPTTYPTFNDSEGVLLDQWLAWAWVRSTDTTVTLFDLRTLSNSRQIRTYRLASLAALDALTGLIDGDQGFVTTGTEKCEYLRSGGVWVISTDFTSSITAGSGITIAAASLDIDRGKRARLYLQVSKATTISSGDVIATIPTSTRPTSTIIQSGFSQDTGFTRLACMVQVSSSTGEVTVLSPVSNARQIWVTNGAWKVA
jgi:hypothetical protein